VNQSAVRNGPKLLNVFAKRTGVPNAEPVLGATNHLPVVLT
jgi:hypothetical protein